MKKIICFVAALMILASIAVVPAMAEEENVALYKYVYCESDDPNTNPSMEGLAFFSADYLTDGEAPVWDGVSQDTPLCWYGASATQDTHITITVDLENLYALKKIVLVPTSFLNGMNMPTDFKVLVSKDESDWVTVGEVTGRSGATSENFVYEFEEEARFIMVSITKMSSVKDDNFYYSGIAEIEAYGDLLTTPSPEPTEEPQETPAGEATEAPSETTPAATDDKSDEKDDKKSDFPVVPVAIAAVAVVAIVVVVVIVKKKKA
ncbi:MAG: discoidin domain-containing protein [Clostridiaceae bacterium]|jgi:hypothetical protein|nr:discoidin domain-containing protein [Clostridiaceae bacterium]